MPDRPGSVDAGPRREADQRRVVVRRCRDRDFQLRPIGSVQDILRVTPGLVIVQHSGGGKANQYFLRGFDADHGTDLALSIDGVPINLVSHAHGQGFADTNFIIPEVVERVEITKGPYFASQGDFATAGAVNMVSRDELRAQLGGRRPRAARPGTARPAIAGSLIASPKFESLPVEGHVRRRDRPHERPLRQSGRTGTVQAVQQADLQRRRRPPALTLSEMSYARQLARLGADPGARGRAAGLISRFGSIDPDEGGNTARHQLALAVPLRPTENSELRALAYAGDLPLQPVLELHALSCAIPDNGDEIEQVDRRTFYGAKVSYRVVAPASAAYASTRRSAPTCAATTSTRSCGTRVHRAQIAARAQQRRPRDAASARTSTRRSRRRAGCAPTSAGAPTCCRSPSTTAHAGAPIPTAPRSGVGAAHQLSPKASLIVDAARSSRARSWTSTLNYGHGFHSNDVRGAFAQPAVTPLDARDRRGARRARAALRSLGSGRRAVAARSRQRDGLERRRRHDRGQRARPTAAASSSRRRYELTPWLAADADAHVHEVAVHAPIARTAAGWRWRRSRPGRAALSARHALGPGVARGGLRFYGIGDRPATDDGALSRPASRSSICTSATATAGSTSRSTSRTCSTATFRSAQFATVSRLPGEPAIGAPVPAGFSCGSNARLATAPAAARGRRFYGCEDVNYTPAYPLTLRVMATLFLD